MTTQAEHEIRRRITESGKITFAEFMEVALYHPVDGYYTSKRIGATGDYYTSPKAHPAFGASIAVELHAMWEALGRPSRFDAVEMGAGIGQLARDVVDYSQSLPGGFGDALRYVAVDRASPALRHSGFRRNDGGRRVTSNALPFEGLVGCVLSNELLDAFPVHRFEIEDGAVREVYVTLTDGAFTEVLDEPSTPLLAERLVPLRPSTSSGRTVEVPFGRLRAGSGRGLADGFRGEVNSGIGPWMAEVAAALDRGFVLTIDYGYEAAELYSEKRPRGTLQTYSRHTQGADPYRDVGRQDLTAHVDFSAVVADGEAVGLRPVALWSQASFLRGLGLDSWMRRLRSEVQPQRERDANMMAMRDLVRPDGLGAFKVLVQEKGSGVGDPPRLSPDASPASGLPVPLLGAGHIRLLEGRYSDAIWHRLLRR